MDSIRIEGDYDYDLLIQTMDTGELQITVINQEDKTDETVFVTEDQNKIELLIAAISSIREASKDH